jgi:hypothetical protein
MTEFGHIGIIAAGVCLDTWGVGPFKIEVGDKIHLFEDSDRFGPLLLRKDGMPLENQPRERHPFWKAHRAWVKQGRRTESGVCVWQPLRPDQVRIIKRGRHRFIDVIEAGDDGCDEIEIVETVVALRSEKKP